MLTTIKKRYCTPLGSLKILGDSDRYCPRGEYTVEQVGFDYIIIENLRLRSADCDPDWQEKRKIGGFEWLRWVRW
jgi:hypothetical protein